MRNQNKPVLPLLLTGEDPRMTTIRQQMLAEVVVTSILRKSLMPREENTKGETDTGWQTRRNLEGVESHRSERRISKNFQTICLLSARSLDKIAVGGPEVGNNI